MYGDHDNGAKEQLGLSAKWDPHADTRVLLARARRSRSRACRSRRRKCHDTRARTQPESLSGYSQKNHGWEW